MMQKTKKKLEVLIEEEGETISGVSCSSTSRQRHSWSVSEEQEDILNRSPQHFNCNPKTSELVKEIAALELEIIGLEQYLLSLYRTTFDQYLATSPTTAKHGFYTPSESNAPSLSEHTRNQAAHQVAFAVNSDEENMERYQFHSYEKCEKKRATKGRNVQSYSSRSLPAGSENNIGLSPRDIPKKDVPKSASAHHSLADHLDASLMNHVPEYSCKLSEEIISCIAAIYFKLATPAAQPAELIASPTASLSSSSTLSPQDDPCNSWSPRCFSEAAGSPLRIRSLKDEHSPHSNVVEISRIHVDGDRFDFASKMLNIFSSLIRRLEAVDPKKMEYHEQLTFWINIHNALVMHAFLAYGLHHNHMKNTFSFQKATYSIGGISINACIIQSLIIGCQLPHRPAKWLRALLPPVIHLIKGDEKHPYALDHPEPLTHFALSLGAESDPAVRKYTAKSIFQELELARDEYIQANVSVHKAAKILLPRVLYYYAKDAYLKLPELLEMVCNCMPKAQQQRFLQGCLKEKVDKFVEWSPYKSSFRYLVHRDLAQQMYQSL